MLLLIEIGMLIGGLYAVITGKIPSLLVGGNSRKVEGLTARILGVIFILPFPLGIFAGVVMALFFGEKGASYVSGLDILFVFGAAIIGFIVVYATGKKDTSEKTIEKVIEEYANNALFYSIFGLLGFGIATIFFSPLAIYRCKQVNQLVDEHHTGQQFLSRVNIARVLAVIALAFWGLGLVLWVAVIFGVGMR